MTRATERVMDTSPMRDGVEQLIREASVPIDGLEGSEDSGLLERIGDARVVLLGEATHGTSEFYRWRARLTRELVMHAGFTVLTVDADWPDASRVDRHVRHLPKDPKTWRAFERFPQWRWRNFETVDLIEWLRAHNAEVRSPAGRVGFFGLDVYGCSTAASEVIRYLAQFDPASAEVARLRFGLLSPWHPAAAPPPPLPARYRAAEEAVVRQLETSLQLRAERGRHDHNRHFDAACTARVLGNAEHAYRVLFRADVEAWKLREQHLFDTLAALLTAGGSGARAVVWAHNAQVADAPGTLGHHCRAQLGASVYTVGFGTDHGTVLAARAWDEPGERLRVRRTPAGSTENLFHRTELPAFSLPLRAPLRSGLRDALAAPRPLRSIGLVSGGEGAGDFENVSLPTQFDEYVWFDETRALNPLVEQVAVEDVHDTWPFGL